MSFKFDSDQDDGINDINITPFVDVVLVLLVIFMVTAPIMVKESLNINLPKSGSSDNSPPARLGISINSNGQILINGTLVDSSGLEVEAITALADNPNVQALISADKEAKHGAIIKVIDTIKKVGIENFAFQVERVVRE